VHAGALSSSMAGGAQATTGSQEGATATALLLVQVRGTTLRRARQHASMAVSTQSQPGLRRT
jgi:hypothetical protein